ncbi:MAG: hypothetical protein CVU11_14385 [Bacteroidetes bacterium HGW-Bacteroidetes-6]|nr:MAG: hypothetical protein CVU11_14385 [Bacteroidetes bacterium HGW-Bacteroidetes-6]
MNFASVTFAQKNDSLLSVEAGTDFMSSYVWRGMRLVSSPAIQPYMAVSAGNFSLGAWSSWHFSSNWNEIDLIAAYENDFMSFGITDYFTASNYQTNDFFNYQSGESSHIVELNAGFPGNEKIPFRLLVATNVFGDIDINNNEYYSTFAELSWMFKLDKFDSELRLGFTPTEGMYADNAAIVETAFRVERKIEFQQDLSLNLISEFIVNPYEKEVYLVCGLGINF